MKSWILFFMLMGVNGLAANSSSERTYTTQDFKTIQGGGFVQLFPAGTRINAAGKDKVAFPTDQKYGGIKVVTEKTGDYSTLGTPPLPVKPNTAYKIFFEARGNIKLTAYTYGKARKDFFVNLPLGGDWKGYVATVNIPADVSYLAVYLLNWQQSGWFEIRNFEMEEVK